MREGQGRVKPPPLQRAALGKLGEGFALASLMLQGWWPVARPRFEAVQTDLVLRRGNSLLLVEVKTRWRPLRSEQLISPTQRRRLRQQAAFWAARCPNLAVRLMLVQVTPRWPLVRCWAVPLD